MTSTKSNDLAGKTALSTEFRKSPSMGWKAAKIIAVTGSGRGIGAAIALALAERGMNVVINYSSSVGPAEATAEKARSFGVKAITVKADVSSKRDLDVLFETAIKEFKTLDLVMSNSGIEHFGSLNSVTEQEIDRTFDINVKAQYFVAQEAYKHLADNGRLILTSSISAQKGFPRHAIYAASKAAIQGMVKCLAWDFGSRGITVNCLAHGGVKSDMWDEAAAKYFPDPNMSSEDIERAVGSWSPFKRPGYPEDIAGFVTLLARPESQWMTGQTFNLSGGAQM